MLSKIRRLFGAGRHLLKYLLASAWCKLSNANSDTWLISERGLDARDNGFHFYKYMKAEHPDKDVKYAIDPKSVDAKKIERNDIIKYGSFKHYVLFKTAPVLISTHIMGYSPDMSLFSRMDKKGLLHINGKKAFLLHGVACNYTPYLEKKNTKLDVFVSNNKIEHNFIKRVYKYDDSTVKCTGMARFDALQDESTNNKKKTILIMPTFRRWLNYEDNFVETDYFKAWNSLLNDKEFVRYIETHDYEVLFYPHFEIQKRISDFHASLDNIKICRFDNSDVQDLLRQSDLLITDYSSVAFDFAYMNKIVLYYQFDEKRFRTGHYQEGYFDYREMGFGPVVDELDKLVVEVEKYFDGKTDKKYFARANKFFERHDSRNCERIYVAIKSAGASVVSHE